MDSAGIALPSTVRIGRWWFQRRSVTPLPLFLMLVLLPPQFQLGPPAFVAVLMGIAFAEALRVWAVGYAGSATRTRGDDVPSLVHAGPFRYVRNPLYIANMLMYTLVGVLYGFSALSLIILLFSAIQYTFIVAFEEDTLKKTFGEVYKVYARKVPRWWPALTPKVPSSQHEFSLKKALRSERSTLYSMALMGGLLVVKTIYLNR
jgi:protein-S-isoprenylcysteine O-methyltransferase Ste14